MTVVRANMLLKGFTAMAVISAVTAIYFSKYGTSFGGISRNEITSYLAYFSFAAIYVAILPRVYTWLYGLVRKLPGYQLPFLKTRFIRILLIEEWLSDYDEWKTK